MFAKLLKYDLCSVGRIWWILAVTLLGLSIGAGFCLRDFIIKSNDIHATTGDTLTATLEIIALMLFYVAIIAFVIVTAILLFIRYYKNFFTDEGYLTFTLPVSRTKLYLSKLLNSVIWNTATTAVIILSVIIILLIARMPDGEKSVFGYFVTEILPQIKNYIDFSNGWLILSIIEGIIWIILYVLFSTILTHLCITVGAVVTRKAKVVVALAIYYAVGVVVGIAYSISSFAFTLWMATAAALYPASFGLSSMPLVVLGLLLLCIVTAVAVAVVYLVNITCLERKLNLA